jgi:hypothetical protein
MFVSGRQSLRQIHVKGDIIVKPETRNGECCFDVQLFTISTYAYPVIITRSRAKQSPPHVLADSVLTLTW